MKRDVIELVECKREVMSPSRFLRMTDEERQNVERTRIHPPRLGRRNFGFLEVIYRNGTWRPGRGQACHAKP